MVTDGEGLLLNMMDVRSGSASFTGKASMLLLVLASETVERPK
jgi:hypothetical protein